MCEGRVLGGQGGRDALSRQGRQSRQGKGSSAAGGFFNTAPARPSAPAPSQLQRRAACGQQPAASSQRPSQHAGLLVQLRGPEQRQPEAAGSTCWSSGNRPRIKPLTAPLLICSPGPCHGALGASPLPDYLWFHTTAPGPARPADSQPVSSCALAPWRPGALEPPSAPVEPLSAPSPASSLSPTPPVQRSTAPPLQRLAETACPPSSSHCYTCLSVCMSVCLPVCLSVCLSVCLPAYLSVRLSVCPPACPPACLPAYLPTVLPAPPPLTHLTAQCTTKLQRRVMRMNAAVAALRCSGSPGGADQEDSSFRRRRTLAHPPNCRRRPPGSALPPFQVLLATRCGSPSAV